MNTAQGTEHMEVSEFQLCVNIIIIIFTNKHGQIWFGKETAETFRFLRIPRNIPSDQLET